MGDPVEVEYVPSLNSSAYYIDKRATAVGWGPTLGGGFLLYVEGLALPYLVPRELVDLGLADAMPYGNWLYSSFAEARAALVGIAGSWFSYVQLPRGVVAPSVFSPATTPRIIALFREAVQHFAEWAKEMVGGQALNVATGALVRLGFRILRAVDMWQGPPIKPPALEPEPLPRPGGGRGTQEGQPSATDRGVERRRVGDPATERVTGGGRRRGPRSAGQPRPPGKTQRRGAGKRPGGRGKPGGGGRPPSGDTTQGDPGRSADSAALPPPPKGAKSGRWIETDDGGLHWAEGRSEKSLRNTVWQHRPSSRTGNRKADAYESKVSGGNRTCPYVYTGELSEGNGHPRSVQFDHYRNSPSHPRDLIDAKMRMDPKTASIYDPRRHDFNRALVLGRLKRQEIARLASGAETVTWVCNDKDLANALRAFFKNSGYTQFRVVVE